MGFYISYELEVKILLFLYEYPIDPAQLIEKIILSPMLCSALFATNQISIYVLSTSDFLFCSINPFAYSFKKFLFIF